MTEARAFETYSVFGLSVRSEVPLPELFATDREGVADVTIERGDIPAPAGAPPGLSVVDDGLLLIVPGVARYRVAEGRSITVDADRDVPARNVRLFLLGSAFGALLHQRGLLPLHANAVEVGGRAVAFMGESGAGKSTLAAAFHDLGCKVIADDVCVVGFDPSGAPYAAPGLPRLRLWAEALELMGRDTAGFDHSYVTDEEFDKFDVPLEPSSAVRSAMPLSALYLLARGSDFAIERLSGVDAAEAVFANTYRGAFVSAAGGQQSHWLSAMAVVKRLPVFRASRVWDLAKLTDQCRRLLAHAEQAAVAQSALGGAEQ